MSLVARLAILAVLLFPSCAHATEPLASAPNLLALISPESAEVTAPACPPWIKLEGEIGDPTEIIGQLAACADRAVVVEINSPGGNVFAALEIQKAIERHPKPVICVVDGLAASAAFVTLQSCDVRTMTDRSILMAHHASFNGAAGQSQELQNATDALRAIDRALTLFCAKRMGMEPDAFEAHVSGGREWWLALDEATKMRAVDFEVSGVDEALALAAP